MDGVVHDYEVSIPLHKRPHDKNISRILLYRAIKYETCY